MTLLLLGASLGLLGIVAGIYVTGLIHDHRVCDLSAGQYTAMHQMRDKTFRRVMPVVGLATVALVMASAIFAVSSGAPWALAAIAAALLVADVAFTITRQMPLNSRVQSWTKASIPADWARIRDQWAAQHRVRVMLAMIAYSSFSRPCSSPRFNRAARGSLPTVTDATASRKEERHGHTHCERSKP